MLKGDYAPTVSLQADDVRLTLLLVLDKKLLEQGIKVCLTLLQPFCQVWVEFCPGSANIQNTVDAGSYNKCFAEANAPYVYCGAYAADWKPVTRGLYCTVPVKQSHQRGVVVSL